MARLASNSITQKYRVAIQIPSSVVAEVVRLRKDGLTAGLVGSPDLSRRIRRAETREA